MPSLVVQLLKEYKAWQNKERLKCGDQWYKDWNEGCLPNGMVFDIS